MSNNRDVSTSPIISIHIVKTAGTSLRYNYEHFFGRDHVVLDYPHYGIYRADETPKRKEIQSLASPVARIINATQQIYKQLAKKRYRPPNTYLIHGHFKPRDWLAIFPDAPLVTIVREPLDRMWSHWTYLRQVAEEGRARGGFTLPLDWFKADMPFEEFALSEVTRDLQSKTLGFLPPSRFDIIGTTASLDKIYFKRFCERFEIQKKPLKVLTNVTKKKEDMNLSPEFISRFRRFHKNDYDFYEYASKEFGD